MSTTFDIRAIVSDANAQGLQKAATTAYVDPLAFRGRTAEERTYLQQHKDMMTPSIQETTRMKWTIVKRIYNACPRIVQFIVMLIILIVLLVLIPTVLIGFIEVCKMRRIEMISVVIMLFATWWTWRTFVKDV